MSGRSEPTAPPKRSLAAALGVVAALAYPFALYVGVTRWGSRGVGFVALALVVPRAVVTLLRARREDALAALRIPLTIGALAGLSALVDDARFLLAMPVLVNVGLLVNFAASLRGDTPIVERFARMQVSALSDAERAWCRHVTVAWCVFFALNAAVAAALALAAPLVWWALYTGVVAYALVGVMFTVEYVLRSYRFRRYGAALPDRVMAALLPPRSTA